MTKNNIKILSKLIAKYRKKLYNAFNLGGRKMKLEQNEKHMLFNTTQLPDVFFS